MDGQAFEVSVVAGEPTPVWCDHCLLPSAYTVDILIVDDNGVSLVGNITGCPDCRSGFFADNPTP